MAARAIWLGQASLRIELGDAVVLVDPWCSPHEGRLTPPPPLELLEGADVILITHEHLDHLDEPFLPTLSERSPEAVVVLPRCLVDRVDRLFDQVLGVVPGERVDGAGLVVEAVPAIHGVTMEDAYGDGSSLGDGPRFVGYLCNGGGVAVYHAGDTILTDGVVAGVAGRGVDAAFVPINGRDAERERRDIVGNADAREAVELALAAGARTLVPLHWDGFAGNTADPQDAVAAAAGRLDVVVPERGTPFDLVH